MFWPAPLIFTKLLKVPIALLRKINVRIILLDDMLVMAQTLEEILQAKETLIFSVTKFGFCDKYKKVATNTSDGNRVFGVSDKFSNTI